MNLVTFSRRGRRLDFATWATVYNRGSDAAETINKEEEPSARRAVSALRLYLCNQQQADLTTIRRHSADKNAERPDEQEGPLKIILPMTNQ